MENLEIKVSNELGTSPFTKNQQKGMENHLKAAKHFEEAAKKHKDAATFLGQGKHEKAAQSTIVAHGFADLGKRAQRNDARRHTITGYPV